MKQRSKARKSSSKTKTTAGNQTAAKAVRSAEQTLRAGQELGQAETRRWSGVLGQAASPAEWQKGLATFTSLAGNLLPMAQRNVEEAMVLLARNSRTGAELISQAVEAAQTPTPAQSQAKWMEFWIASLRAIRSNAEAVSELSSRTINSWINFVRQNTETTEMRLPKPMGA